MLDVLLQTAHPAATSFTLAPPPQPPASRQPSPNRTLLVTLWVVLKKNPPLKTQYGVRQMAKPQHKIKKANHGRRPANAQAKRAKRRKIRT
jgi:hypothetical protein